MSEQDGENILDTEGEAYLKTAHKGLDALRETECPSLVVIVDDQMITFASDSMRKISPDMKRVLVTALYNYIMEPNDRDAE